MAEWLTIEQCADLLKVSKDTIRRRIKSKEIEAEKQIGDYGLQWMIPAETINKAMQDIEVIPVTRSVSVAELEQAMARTIASAVTSAVQAELQPLKEQVQVLNEKLDKQDVMLNEHYKMVDERLRLLNIKNDIKPKSWWGKLFD